jgi:hypothetical protein
VMAIAVHPAFNSVRSGANTYSVVELTRVRIEPIDVQLAVVANRSPSNFVGA